MTSGMAVTVWANLASHAGMIAGLDRDEHRQPHADRFGRDQRHPLQDDAGLLQALDALPARALRQPDPMRDLRQREARILLQERHDLPVDRIHDSTTREELTPHCRALAPKSQQAVQSGSDSRRDRGAQPGAQRLGQGVDVAVDRPGIVDEPPVGALEPGEPPQAGLADQRAHHPAMDRDVQRAGSSWAARMKRVARATNWLARFSMRRL